MRETARKAAKGAVTGGAAATGGLIALKGVASASVPYLMSSLGTVVSGVGTFHGTTVACVQAFAAGTLGPSLATVGAVGMAVGAAGAAVYNLRRQ